MKKRVVALLLAAVMAWSLLPTATFATDGELAGEGTAESPYQIADAADLMAFAAKVNEGDSEACAELTANIDLTAEDGWVPIGTDASSYSGTFDGKYFTVKLALTVTEDWTESSAGIFGCLRGATVKNLRSEGSIAVSESAGSCQYAGGIAGYADGNTTVEFCRSAVSINIDSVDFYAAGGIIGYVCEEPTLSYCANYGDLTGEAEGSSFIFGGLVGASDSDRKMLVNYCYNRGTVSAVGDYAYAGGLIGSSSGYDLFIKGCYSSASAVEETDGLVPNWAKPIRTIYGTEAYNDFFGSCSNAEFSTPNISIAEELDGYGSITADEGVTKASLFDSAEDALTYLKSGEDEGAYVAVKDSGWPILAWELKTPTVVTNPKEAAYAKGESDFSAAKSAAKESLKSDYNQKYNSGLYSEAGRAALEDIYSEATAELNRATLRAYADLEEKTAEEITAYIEGEIESLRAAAQDALTALAAVPTKMQETQFAADKKEAVRKLNNSYAAQVKKLNDLRGEAAAVWHEKNGDVLHTLAEKSSELETAWNNGKKALEACTNTVTLNSTLAACQSELEAVLQNCTVDIDSGVTDKWDGAAKTQPVGSGTKADPYKIGTAAELAWFADAVTGGQRAACARLTADIDLNGKSWTPIANGGVNNGYIGTFDGKNHIIHGLSVVNGEKNRPQGLFGTVGRTGTVQNVKVAGRILVRQGDGAGLIAGRNDGVLYNCEASAFLKNSYNLNGIGTSVGNIGGIAGYMTAGYVENCRAWGLFLANGDNYDEGKLVNSSMISQIGGIVGGLSAVQEKDGAMVRYCENDLQIDSYIVNEEGKHTLQGNTVGGIVGGSGIGQVRECVNNAAVTGGENVGGIVGVASPGEGESFRTAYVENKGAIHAGSGVGTAKGAGGIIGRAGGEKTGGGHTQYVGDVSVEYAYNSGTVSAEASGTAAGNAGGLVGVWLSGSVSHARSSSVGNDLWGVVMTATTRIADTAKAVQYDSPVRAGNGGTEKLAATRTLVSKLIRFNAKDSNYAVYGEQSANYNTVIMEYIRRIEVAEDSAAQGILADGKAALAAVPTQLQADRSALTEDMRAYAAARIYDAEGQAAVTALLQEAAEAAEGAETVEDVKNLRQKYLGTENLDGKLAEITPYPVKAADELYNGYIFDKNYSQDDMAQALRAYEIWRLALNAAEDRDGVEAVFADARKAMKELTDSFAIGEDAPDMDAAAAAALELARQEVLDRLSALEREYAAELTALVGDTGTLSDEWKTRLETALAADKAALHDKATPALDGIDDYAVLAERQAAGERAMKAIYTAASIELSALVASARNENAWSGNTVKPKQENGIYQIGTAEELAWLAEQVNASSDSNEKFDAVLTADIDLGYRPWTPIGFYVDWRNTHPYRGTFDGQGHTVSGLYISADNNGYAGLFGYTASTTTIKNLTVAGEIELKDVSKTNYVGGIVGEANAKMVSCVSRVRIAAAGFGTNDTCAVGGVAGKLGSSTSSMTDCRFEGSVDITCKSGGAYISGGVGGVVGAADGGRLTRCENIGTVTVDKGVGVGGIAGKANYGASFEQCANRGHISNDTAAVIGGADKPKGGTGGILGVADSIDSVTVNNCYNTGVVSASYMAGGILGGETSSGNADLVVKNSYNAGRLDVGTRTERIGALAGYPVKGRYCDGLYVLSSSARLTNGWISAQGDSITSAETLTAEGMPEIADLVDSIAGLNRGYPLFTWQMKQAENRRAVIAYLSGYYETYVSGIATAEQQTVLEEKLAQTAAAIEKAETAEAIISAYNKMMADMNTDDLVQAAKEAALEKLTALKAAAAEKYPALEAELAALLEAEKGELDRCKTGTQAQSRVDAYAAGVADLLITDAQGAKLSELAEKLKNIEDEYSNLSDAQQALVVQYGRLAAMKTLQKQYAADLDDLKTWADEDAQQYGYLAETAKKLHDEAAAKLGDCTDKAGMDAVMNGYVAAFTQALTDDLSYKSGTTTAAAVKALEERIGNAQKAYDALTAEQKELFGGESLAALQGAGTLLNTYNNAVMKLNARLEQDKKAHEDLAATLDELAAQAHSALADSVDVGGMIDALTAYANGVKAAVAENAKPAEEPGTADSDQPKADNIPTAQPEQTKQSEETKEPETKTPAAEQPTQQPVEKPQPDDSQSGEEIDSERSADLSVLWMGLGVLAAAGVIFLLWKWFAATRKNRRRDDE